VSTTATWVAPITIAEMLILVKKHCRLHQKLEKLFSESGLVERPGICSDYQTDDACESGCLHCLGMLGIYQRRHSIFGPFEFSFLQIPHFLSSRIDRHPPGRSPEEKEDL
jgi:hypothetical protein